MTAVLLHGGLALAVLALPEDLIGSAGSDFDAISVEVTIVPGSALESRARQTTQETEASAALSQLEGNAETTAVEVEAAAPTVSQPPPERAPESKTARDEPLREPPRQTATIVVPEPDPAPADETAPTLPVARQERPAPNEPETTAEPPPPEPVRDESPPKPVDERKPNATPSVAATAGGAASSSVGTVTRPSRAAVAASPGAVRAFSRQVAAALSRSRPRPGLTRSRGTTLIVLAISESGDLEFVRIARSSGDGVLDNAALAAVRKASLPSPPPGLTLKQRTYEMPYHFR